MGSTEDPPDGAAVARTCIGAVIVYTVSHHPDPRHSRQGILSFLWMSNIPASTE